MDTQINITFKNLGDGHYQVMFGEVLLGEVYKSDVAWSYAPWVIVGDRSRYALGGVNNAARRRIGFPSRAAAARQLSIMNSVQIINELGRQE